MISAIVPLVGLILLLRFSAIARSVMISAATLKLEPMEEACFSAIARSVMISAP